MRNQNPCSIIVSIDDAGNVNSRLMIDISKLNPAYAPLCGVNTVKDYEESGKKFTQYRIAVRDTDLEIDLTDVAGLLEATNVVKGLVPKAAKLPPIDELVKIEAVADPSPKATTQFDLRLTGKEQPSNDLTVQSLCSFLVWKSQQG